MERRDPMSLLNDLGKGYLSLPAAFDIRHKYTPFKQHLIGRTNAFAAFLQQINHLDNSQR